MDTEKEKAVQQVQFIIPPPYRAWCHHCDKGFMSIEELMKHTLTIRVWKG
jgi:hypothetical protein